MNVKHGYEVYDISVTFKEEEKNPEMLLDVALAKINYDFDVDEIKEDEDGYPAVKMSVEIPCSWVHHDAFWDDNGGGPAEDDVEYSGMEPDELESYLKQELNAVYVSMDYREFVED